MHKNRINNKFQMALISTICTSIGTVDLVQRGSNLKVILGIANLVCGVIGFALLLIDWRNNEKK